MFRLVESGDNAITVYLADQPGDQALARVVSFCAQAREVMAHHLQDLVPSYCSVTLYFDVLRSDFYSVRRLVWGIADRLDTETVSTSTSDPPDELGTSAGKVHVLPVYYGQDAAMDMARVAQVSGFTAEQIIATHSAQRYRVYALGFRPGFAFMGETPARLRVPRLEVPRKRVPAGAVAIAGTQAAIYPSASPGGWNIIGRCPTTLFSCPNGEPKVLLGVGDVVQFQPVSRQAFLDKGGRLHE